MISSRSARKPGNLTQKLETFLKPATRMKKKHNRLEFKMPISIISGKIKNRNYNRAQNNITAVLILNLNHLRLNSAHFKTVNVYSLEKLPSWNSQNFKSDSRLVRQEYSHIWTCHLPTILEKCGLLINVLVHFNFLNFKSAVYTYNPFFKERKPVSF